MAWAGPSRVVFEQGFSGALWRLCWRLSGVESLPIAHRTTYLSAHTTPAKFRPAPHQLSFAAPFALAHGGHQSCWCHSVTNYTAHSGPAGLYNTAFLPADYMNKPKFLENFWEGFREVLGPRHVIKGLDK